MYQHNIEGDALRAAYNWHGTQTRKDSDVPYIIHPVRVGLLISVAFTEVPRFETGGDNPDMIVAAAFLHDVVEDCNVNLADFEQEFGYHAGNHLYRLVNEVTEPSRVHKGDPLWNRAARKSLDAQHYGNSSPAGATIKLADIIDNLSEIEKLQPRFLPVYMREMLALVPLLAHGHPTLYARAEQAIGITSEVTRC